MHRLATSATKVDGIRHPEVVISPIFSIFSFISSKEWMYHAAVVMENDNIILVGGQQRHDSHKRGEIVKSKDGNVVSLSGGSWFFCRIFYQLRLCLGGVQADCESFARRTFTTPKIGTFTTPKFEHLSPPNSDIYQPPNRTFARRTTAKSQFFFLFLAHFSWFF